MEFSEYTLVLHKLNEEPIQELRNIVGLTISPSFIGVSELNFQIPFNRQDNNGELVENEIYKIVEGDHLIKVNEEEYFIIASVVEKSEDDGYTYKEVKCFTREYELSQKRLVNYKASSRMLYDSENQMLDGLERGIFNYIFNHITMAWSIGYVDPDVITRKGKDVHRALDFSDSNLLQVFQDLQTIFKCVLTFDTIEQKINIYDVESKLGQDKGLYISDYNFIREIDKTIKSDDIKTRLYLYGKDNVSIQSISSTGQPYIDNFDFYKTTKYMTQDLIDALDSYDDKISNIDPNFKPLLKKLKLANEEMEVLLNFDHQEIEQKGLVALNRELSIIQSSLDVKIQERGIKKDAINKADSGQLTTLQAELNAINKEIEKLSSEKDEIDSSISNKKDEIEIQQEAIDGIKGRIEVLQNQATNTANFTQEQLKELDRFIKVETYTDSSYTENDVQELYDEGVRELNRISQPPIQFEINSIDFLSLVEFKDVRRRFVLGDIVTLEHSKVKFDYKVRLVGYEHDVDGKDLVLKFSNKNSMDDATLYLRDLLEDFKTTSTQVDFNKYKWEKADSAKTEITRLVDQMLGEAKQDIMDAVGQRHLFDESGLWLYKEDDNGIIDDEQIRAINNTIALTDDNWKSVKTAITPIGVVGEHIYGKIGAFAKMTANQVVVGDTEEPILDHIDREVTSKVDDLGDTIDDAFSDTSLTSIEAKSIKLSLENVRTESENMIEEARKYSLSTSLFEDSLDSLVTYLSGNWIGKDKDYPLPITDIQRDEIDAHFKDLEDKKSELLSQITDAVIYDKAVVKGETYNHVTITPEFGIQVKDRQSRERVRLGNYTTGKYGLLIKDKTGNKTILDEDGMLQVWQEGGVDNVSATHPLQLNVFIPTNTLSIRETILRFQMLNFRSYSQATTSEGYKSDSTSEKTAVYSSTGDGGYRADTTTSDGGVNTTTGSKYFESQTTHDATNVQEEWVNTQSTEGHTHRFYKTMHHEHTFYVPSHSHDYSFGGHYHSFSVPEHYHSFTVPAHSHSFTVDSHSHGITNGIFTGTRPSIVTVRVNGRNVGSYSSNQSNINITSYMNIGQWNSVELIPNILGRIDATIFNQAMIGFN